MLSLRVKPVLMSLLKENMEHNPSYVLSINGLFYSDGGQVVPLAQSKHFSSELEIEDWLFDRGRFFGINPVIKKIVVRKENKMTEPELIEAVDGETFKVTFYALGIKGGFYNHSGGMTQYFTQAKLFKSVAEARAWQKVHDPVNDESYLLEGGAHISQV